MLHVLRSYEAGQLGLGRAVADLEALLSCLEGEYEIWKKSFRRQWAVLEHVYASMLDKGLDVVPSDLQALIDAAVAALQRLATEAQTTTPSP